MRTIFFILGYMIYDNCLSIPANTIAQGGFKLQFITWLKAIIKMSTDCAGDPAIFCNPCNCGKAQTRCITNYVKKFLNDGYLLDILYILEELSRSIHEAVMLGLVKLMKLKDDVLYDFHVLKF